MQFWVNVWTVVWFGGLGIFSLLSVVIILFAGKDLVFLLNSLRKRHEESREP